MKKRQAAIFAATLAATAALGGGVASAAPAHGRVGVRAYDFTAYAEGYGPSRGIATRNADQFISDNYYGCQVPYITLSASKDPEGLWTVDLQANGCQGYL